MSRPVDSSELNAAQFETARMEVDRLWVRQQELLALIVRLTNETPYPDEVKAWTGQRAKMIAEIGTLKAKVRELERLISTRKP